MAVMKALIVLALVCVPGASANPAPTLAPAPAPMVPVPGTSAKPAPTLVGASAKPAPTLAGASANPTPTLADASANPTPTLAPAPAPMVPALLTEHKLCIVLSMKSHWLACVVKTAMACFASSAVTREATFHTCFIAGVVTENCLAKANNDEKYHCVGLEINDDLLPCIGEVAWNCYDGSMVYSPPTFGFYFYTKVSSCSA